MRRRIFLIYNNNKRRNTKTKQPKRKKSVQNLLDAEIDFLREAAGLSPNQIFGMSIEELLVKMEPWYYSVELRLFNEHDIHLQSKVLDYIVPMTRRMLEMTEAKRLALKSQEERGIGEV